MHSSTSEDEKNDEMMMSELNYTRIQLETVNLLDFNTVKESKLFNLIVIQSLDLIPLQELPSVSNMYPS